ncbi:hypothetical protein MAR_037253 [Mya arenaria]|uniref:Uncharacterized protein n=1 Tax=Mya arenaria TaxID=6604 RepID=A0ABY7FRU4_MYAAR|nr:hypothetical protein MAR_037253 [Mya arenaria]
MAGEYTPIIRYVFNLLGRRNVKDALRMPEHNLPQCCQKGHRINWRPTIIAREMGEEWQLLQQLVTQKTPVAAPKMPGNVEMFE